MNEFTFFDFGDTTSTIELPLPVVINHEGINVVRDDLFPGGTKRRAFTTFVEAHPNVDEWVYASPRTGYAQLSLAYACREFGKKATVFVPKGKKLPLTLEAEKMGAEVHLVPMGFLTNLQYHARTYVEETPGASLVPFGGDHPIIVQAMRDAALSIDIEPPKEVWTVISSGVLSRGLQLAWPEAKFYGVKIGHNTTERERGRAETIDSPYKFIQECKVNDRPPFPSSLTYDSKAWPFIKARASEGALFWNVGA